MAALTRWALVLAAIAASDGFRARAQERRPPAPARPATADAGHFPHWEQPEAFVDKLAAFVEGNR